MSLARHFPAGWEVGCADPCDADHVGARMRIVDRIALETLEGRAARDVLAGYVANAGLTHARVLRVAGRPAALYGLRAAKDYPGDAMTWVATVDDLPHEDVVFLMWMSRMQVDAWQRRWPVLRACCDRRNLFHLDWLNWLGFRPHGKSSLPGPVPLALDLYIRTADRKVRRQ